MRVSYPAPELPSGPRAGLIVATARYVDPTLQQLRAPSQDAAGLSALLSDPTVGGFTVTQLVDRSSYELRMEIERYLNARTSEDLLVVYLSCHGVLDRRGRLYFTATDTDRTMLSSTGVAASWLLDQLDECRAAQQVVILDCCFSGAFDPRSKGSPELDLDRLTGSGRGRAVLTASRHYEYSFEGESVDGEPTPSVFTAGLIEGLASGAADPLHKGFISVDDAYDYAYRYVQEHSTDQTPQRWLFGAEGKIFLARNPAGRVVQSTDLPDEVRHALESRYPVMRLGAVEILAEWLADPDPARRLTATTQLHEIAESDIRRVADAARQALRDRDGDAGPDAAAPVPAILETAPAAPEPAAIAEPEPEVPKPDPEPEAPEPEPEVPEPEPVRVVSHRAVAEPLALGLVTPERPAESPVEQAGLARSINTHRLMTAAVAAIVLVAVIAVTVLTRHAFTRDDSTTGSSAGVARDPTSVLNASTKTGGTLSMVATTDVDSFDPARSYYGWIWNFQRSFFARTLLTYAAKPGAPTLVPDLATAMPTVSDNGKKYTFHLKPGLKFDNGAPIRSADIKYGIERGFATDVLPGGPVYLMAALDNGQSYRGPYKDTDAKKLGLKSVQTPDDSTIAFTLARPMIDFAHYLAMPQAAPVPAAKDLGSKYERRPVSSGPYRFSTDTNAATIKLVRNPAWTPATDQVRKALPDQIELTVGKSAAEQDAALLAGRADIAGDQVGVQADTRSKILADPELMPNAVSAKANVIRHFALNTKIKPFDNVHCRRAVQYAVDKAALRGARGGPEMADIATSMLLPSVPGYDADRDPYRTRSGKPQLAEAHGELVQCGHPDGFPTKIVTRNTGTGVAVAAALQAALAKVGIKATVEQVDSNLYSETVGSPANLKGKGYGIISSG